LVGRMSKDLKLHLRSDVEITNPEKRIREYCDIEIYQGYDDQHNIGNQISSNDIDVANKLYAMIDRYDPNESLRILQSSSIPTLLASVRNSDLSMSNMEWATERENIRLLLREFLSISGIGLAKATKILHLKRPRLFPILDRYVVKFLTGVDIAIIVNKSHLLKVGMDVLDISRSSILHNREAFYKLQQQLNDLPIPLTTVRLFDILCWTTEKWDVRGIRTAAYGTASESLRIGCHCDEETYANSSASKSDSLSNDQELTDVRETVMRWKRRQNQRYKVLRFQVDNGNRWIKPDILRRKLPEIKDPSTVLYDIALRNPQDTPRGRGYYDRQRVYHRGYNAKPILVYNKNLGYRIRPEYFAIISQII